MEDEYLRWLNEEIGRLRQNLGWVKRDLQPAPATPPDERRAREEALSCVEATVTTLTELEQALTQVRQFSAGQHEDIVQQIRTLHPADRPPPDAPRPLVLRRDRRP